MNQNGQAGLIVFLLGLFLLAGCQTLTSGDHSETLVAEMALFTAEAAAIRQAAALSQTRAVETLSAASTKVAELSAVNGALAATVRANFTATSVMRVAVVSAADMGSSLEMMDDMAEGDGNLAVMRVSNVETARHINSANGCSSGNVTRFIDNDELIYVTARVSGLRDGTHFMVDWLYENRTVYRLNWLADYSALFECIWFYVTPDDFPFLPGTYTATLYVNGQPEPSTRFSIHAG